MRKETEALVKEVAAMSTDMSKLTVDRINELAPEAVVPEIQMTAKQKAEMEGIRYIEPKRRLQAFGTLPEKQRREHAYDWEYVKGVYENFIVNGEPVEFWYSKYPGDPDCLWSIPCNIPVYVPRMIARHLEDVQKYHTFSQIAATAEPAPRKAHEVEAMQWFQPSGTHYRGKFRPIGAFL